MSVQEIKKKCGKHWLSRGVMAICFFTSVGLIIGGFVTPPTGVIDGSVLKAVGELLLFPTLLYGFRAIELGLNVKFQKGDTSITIDNDNKEEEQ
jgi:hypothetical protein